MKNIKAYFLIPMVILTAVACNNQGGFKKTPSGLLYKIVSEGKGEPVKKGQFLKLDIIEKIRDSVLYTSQGSVPIFLAVDSVGPNYSPAEIFTMLRKGDSALVVQLADSLQKKANGQPLPSFFKKHDKLTYILKVLDVFPTEELVKQDRDKELQKEKAKEASVIESYLDSSKIKAEKTAKGTYVVVNSVGDGPKVDSGKQVSVLYTGKFFPSGKVFESNATGPRTEPIKFVVGAKGGMIQGWDDGLRLFKKGGKGTLYIPAFLGYDARQGPGGKPFENLIFDVEIVDVTDAPKTSEGQANATNGMPQTLKVNPKPQHK